MKREHIKKRSGKPIIAAAAVTAVLLCAVIIAAAIIGRGKSENGPSETSSSAPTSSEASSEKISVKLISSKPISSDEGSLDKGSPDKGSSDVGSSDEGSSETSEVSSDVGSSDEGSSEAEYAAPDGVSDELPEGSPADWNLILLNPFEGNSISEEIGFTKAKFDSQYVDERAAEAYKNMYAAAKSAGITLFLRSGYRSIDTQRVNYNASVQRIMNQGYSREQAVEQTNLYYTVPGHSEHHSGLAFDIITPQYHQNIYTLDDRFADTDAYTWLTGNCAEYGFILRYPKEKQSVTTINFEPWHYRYVGVEHARYIMSHGICFEEYIELLRQDGR